MDTESIKYLNIKMKIVTIVGARPQFVKAAVVSKAFSKNRKDITEIIVHTGQHFDANMSNVFFDELEIPNPNYNLNISSGTHGQNTGRMIEGIEKVLLEEEPNWVIVYGDTDSTLAGTIAAAKLHIPVAHIEAGLRSFNKFMPEEINRVLTDHASTMLFTPTQTANQNLNNEGIGSDKIRLVGDVMYDATIYYGLKAKKIPYLNISSNFILSTIHRAENTNNLEKLKSIIHALTHIAENSSSVVLPLHPRTKAIIKKENIDISKLNVIDPVGYLEMLWLLKNCSTVITDSGGLQKEAYFFQKPCLTTRSETEWVELLDEGVNHLVGTDTNVIVNAYNNITFPSNPKLLYGVGNAAEQIVKYF
ncbi:non-hydrolyzing UDP-N-acetylglucosamine 2-epimerase [Aquirufa rosea]|nr:UDP-N-acetylglucosamine 2-epimerase (non-hydrolyzing) [Aquirufa rosea]